MCAGGFNVPWIGIETVDEIAVTGSQTGGEFAIPATDMHDQPTLHTACAEDLGGPIVA